MSGTVVSIALADATGAPTYEVNEAVARERAGLEGDRIVREATGDVEPKRQVTLIEAEAVEALERDYGITITPTESRRNICTRGVALNHLVGRDFPIGAAVLRGVELCEPCGTLERLTGKKGIIRGLIHRGGLRAEVVRGGTIRVGDSVG